MYDDTITIFNIINDIGYKTVIENVHLELNTGVAIEGTGMQESDEMLCIIPLEAINKIDKTYVDWKSFKNMSDEERKKHFTFKNGDKLVNGNIDFEITNIKPNTISDLERNFVDVFTLTNYSYKKITGSKLNHFELTGK